MGSADIVPGVSGGTMAFILGIYEELVDSIRRFGSKDLWLMLLRGDIKAFINKSNWIFLISVAVGILSAIALLSHTLEWLLRTHPIFIWSFFFGLVLASAFVVSKRVSFWNSSSIISLLIGIIFALIIVGLVPINLPNTPIYLVLSGAIAICAMILPGISGSFILVILGKYEFILNAVNTRDLSSITYVGLGTILGLLSFSHVLHWLLKRFHNATIAFLIGLMVGSLWKIWPWKAMENNIIPSWDTDLFYGVVLMIVGCAVVLLLEYVSSAECKI